MSKPVPLTPDNSPRSPKKCCDALTSVVKGLFFEKKNHSKSIADVVVSDLASGKGSSEIIADVARESLQCCVEALLTPRKDESKKDD